MVWDVCTVAVMNRYLKRFAYLAPPLVPFYPVLGEGSPTKIDYRKKGTLF